MWTRRVSLCLSTALVLTLAVTPAHADSRRKLCRRTCGFLIGECRNAGGKRHRCRIDVLRDCRTNGPAACEEARDRETACQRVCGGIQSECEQALGGTDSLTVASCLAFASQRCQEHGPDYCVAAPVTENGCNRVAAEDHRGEAVVTVSFSAPQGSSDFDYAPECILVSPGTTVRFEGPFDRAPLVGGIAPSPDPASPFSANVSGSTVREFVLATPGMFPYFSRTFGQILSLPWGAVLVDDGQ